MSGFSPLSSISQKISHNIHEYKFPNAKKVQANINKKKLISPKYKTPKKMENLPISTSSSSTSTESNYITELDEPFEKSISLMFDFSIGLSLLVEVLDSILSYLYAAAICDHSYRSLLHLLNSSLNCSPDAQYLIISIAILVLKEGVPPKKKYWTEFAQAARKLSQTKQKLVTFGKKQNIARRNLINFSGIFTNHQNRVTLDEDIDHDHYGIDIIIDYVLSQGKGKNSYKLWKFPNPSPYSIKRYYHTNDENNSHQENLNENEISTKVSEKLSFNNSFLDTCSYISNSDDIYISSVPVIPEEEEEDNETPQKTTKNFSLTTQKEFELTPVNDLTKAVANLFSDWSSAYGATKKVWELLKIESEFDLNSLYRILPFSYSDFLRSALKTYGEVGDPVYDS